MEYLIFRETPKYCVMQVPPEWKMETKHPNTPTNFMFRRPLVHLPPQPHGPSTSLSFSPWPATGSEIHLQLGQLPRHRRSRSPQRSKEPRQARPRGQRLALHPGFVEPGRGVRVVTAELGEHAVVRQRHGEREDAVVLRQKVQRAAQGEESDQKRVDKGGDSVDDALALVVAVVMGSVFT